jgi:hypothetical protein
MRGFVFAVVFIVVFSTLVASIPAGLQGIGDSPDTIIPVDPKLLTGFEETENWTRTDYTGVIPNYQYILPAGGRTWSSDWIDLADDYFTLAALTYWWIILTGVDTCKFVLSNGTSRGTTLSIDEIEGDAVDGSVRYSLLFTTTGNDAGAFVVFWNTTLYADPQDAHDNDVLNLLHGVGFSSSATNDIGSLLVGLLFLSLPEVPVLINALLATPIWACIIYVLWYVIKEMIPFI